MAIVLPPLLLFFYWMLDFVVEKAHKWLSVFTPQSLLTLRAVSAIVGVCGVCDFPLLRAVSPSIWIFLVWHISNIGFLTSGLMTCTILVYSIWMLTFLKAWHVILKYDSQSCKNYPRRNSRSQILSWTYQESKEMLCICMSFFKTKGLGL